MKSLSKRDLNGVRTPVDVERRYKLGIIEPTAEEVEELKEKWVVDDFLSTTSFNPVQNKVITQNLNNKVNKETGKGLSTNDFTDEYKNKVDVSSKNNHTHNNKDILDTITEENIENWNNNSASNVYDLSQYKVTNLTILRSSCTEKNKRVCINFVGTLSMATNTTTTLFNLPSGLRPSITKDFVVFGQSSNTDGYVGYGYVTPDGLLQVRFNAAISSYIRFSAVYDLD